MNTEAARSVVGVRFEGGLGDHILAMRVLPFIRQRYPDHDIVVYSDSAEHVVPVEATRMSPYVAKVVPIRAEGYERKLKNIVPHDLEVMYSADHFIDAWGETMFADAALSLGVPIFEILAQRSELVVPAACKQAAAEHLRAYGDATFVALNLTTHGAALLRTNPNAVTYFLRRLLERPDVVILNIFTSAYDFPHWPEPLRTLRRGQSLDDHQLQIALCGLSDRILPCVDLSITIVAALLSRCRYFIGVDNGIKHLAWGLNIPRTYFHYGRPRMRHIIRWMPDLHRMLAFTCSDVALESHIDAAVSAVAEHQPRLVLCQDRGDSL